MGRDVAVVAEKLFDETLKNQIVKGEAKYNTRLNTWNGRDAAKDASEELVDAFQYLTQLKLERDEYAKLIFSLAKEFNFWTKIPQEIRENILNIVV